MSALLLNNQRFLALFVLFLAASCSSVAFGAPTDKTLNQTEIHQAYRDGEFEMVIQSIQNFTGSHSRYPKSDSLFIARHLAVIYAANPQTREKGKYFMYRMLEVNPQADLVDMFVSDEVDAAFEKVRREYRSQHPNLYSKSSGPATGAADPTSNHTATIPQPEKRPIPMPKHAEAGQSKKSSSVWWWVAGGAVAVGAGVVAVSAIQNDEPNPGVTHNVKLTE